jgi:hypothetical protein
MATSKPKPKEGKVAEVPSQVTPEIRFYRTRDKLLNQLGELLLQAKQDWEREDNFISSDDVIILSFLKMLAESQLYRARREFDKLWLDIEIIYDTSEKAYLQLNPTWGFEEEEKSQD